MLMLHTAIVMRGQGMLPVYGPCALQIPLPTEPLFAEAL